MTPGLWPGKRTTPAGCWVHDESDTLELWLSNSPSDVMVELEAVHPGVYLIHNDAPRSHTAVLEVMDALPVDRLRAEGIHIVRVGRLMTGTCTSA
jgi:hypothetical protein